MADILDTVTGPSPYSDTRPPFWDHLLSNLKTLPSPKYAIPRTRFKAGGRTIRLTETMVSRYLQFGVEIGGIAYPAGGQDALSELRAASGERLEEWLGLIEDDPRYAGVIERMYPDAFPKDVDQLNALMNTDTGHQRDVPPDVAVQMMRDFLRAQGFTVIDPREKADRLAQLAHVREVYQPLPDVETEETAPDEVGERRGSD